MSLTGEEDCMPTYELTYTGTFKPYVRMTQRGKWVDPEAQKYLSDQALIRHQFSQQMGEKEMIPRRVPFLATIHITHRRGFNNRDIDNEAKAILDAAQGVVFEDDCWLDHLVVSRRRGEVDQVRLTVIPFDGTGVAFVERALKGEADV